MQRDDAIRLRHMSDAATEAIAFAEGKTRSDLNNNRMLVLALVKDIEIIGEAAFQISQESREEYPSVPWDDIIGVAIGLFMHTSTSI